MRLDHSDIIAAQATPSGIGGVGIIRVSGFNLESIAKSILGASLPSARYAHFCSFLDEEGQLIDQGIAIYFKAPHSFTGEDILELQGHGGPFVMDRLLRRVLSLGARMARPGEFSERAFLNGKIDLVQAEAISDLINAQSELAAKSAIRSLQGDFSKRIQQLLEVLIHLRMYIEAAIDFPDEEVDFLPQGKIELNIQQLLSSLLKIKKMAKQGEILQNGINIVIAGPPNSGKSSLLNQLSQKNVAIVTHIPGTTRDLLKQHIQIDGLCLQIIDTAGIRAETSDPIELEGIKRAKDVIRKADHVLLVIDINHEVASEEWFKEIPEGIPATLILNKVDLKHKKMKDERRKNLKHYQQIRRLYVSAKTGEGINALKQHIKRQVGLCNVPENQFIARRRHLEALEKAEFYLLQAGACLKNFAYELIAEELKQAQYALSEITGEFTTDDLLGKIFQSFCIGK